ncbi:MAG: hypothetical protein LBV41_06250 [Cytophagaceae bacterium]|nr:hypothetical protein [Cytophagaceae bacterium]
MANWIFITVIVGSIIFIIMKIAFPHIKREKANKILEEKLFPNGELQKNKVINAFRKLTTQQFSDEQIIDFFMKEKGLQMILIDEELPVSVAKYVRKPTMIDLNYFERIKFHETFINYPCGFEVRKVENSQTLFKEVVVSKGKVVLAKNNLAI